MSSQRTSLDERNASGHMKNSSGGGATDQEQTVVQQAGWDCGMVSSTRWMTTTPLPEIPKHLMQASAKDIVKRGSLRKGRVLCLFADSIRPRQGGTLGVLKNLDTKCPCMDMEFPEGTIRFHGTIVFPNNKYLSLKVGANDVLCEDVFESAILFSKVEWIASGTANKGASVSSLPSSLITRRLHDIHGDLNGVVDANTLKHDDDSLPEAPTQTSAPSNSTRRRSRGAPVPPETDVDDQDDSRERPRSVGRRSTVKRPKYNESGTDSDDEHEIVDLCGSSPTSSLSPKD